MEFAHSSKVLKCGGRASLQDGSLWFHRPKQSFTSMAAPLLYPFVSCRQASRVPPIPPRAFWQGHEPSGRGCRQTEAPSLPKGVETERRQQRRVTFDVAIIRSSQGETSGNRAFSRCTSPWEHLLPPCMCSLPNWGPALQLSVSPLPTGKPCA